MQRMSERATLFSSSSDGSRRRCLASHASQWEREKRLACHNSSSKGISVRSPAGVELRTVLAFVSGFAARDSGRVRHFPRKPSLCPWIPLLHSFSHLPAARDRSSGPHLLTIRAPSHTSCSLHPVDSSTQPGVVETRFPCPSQVAHLFQCTSTTCQWSG